MEIVNEQLPWTTEDEARWNTFLSTESGKRLIPKLAEQAPALLDGTDVNRTLVRNGESRGFSNAIRVLLELTHSPPLALGSPATAYPPLEDDRQWSDGEKLNREKE